MAEQTTILEGYSDLEKGAYLGAIASLATADRTASPEELEYIEALCESATLSEEQNELIRNAAVTQMSDDELNRCLDILKKSDLRFSFVSDLIAFAQADKDYSEEEKQTVQQIASHLGVSTDQFSVLDQFTKKAVAAVPAHASALESQETTPAGFLDSLGFGDKLKSAGINSSALMKGALAILGPIVLSRMFSGGRQRSSGGGMFGGSGGMFGGSGGMLGGGGGMLGGGGGLLGGLLGGGGGLLGGLLGGGRGFGGAGGMLGRILGRRF